MKIALKERISDFFSKFKDKNSRKALIKETLNFLPAVIMFVAFIVLVAIDKHDPRTVLVMLAFVTLLFAVAIIKAYKILWLEKVFKIGFLVLAPPFVFMIVESFTRGLFWGLPGLETITVVNILFYYVLEFFILAFTTRTDVAVIVTTVVPSLLGIANYFSLQARDLPIYPWDILSVRTAMSVVGNYNMYLSPNFKFCIFSIVALIVFAIQLNMRFKFKKAWIGIFPALLSVMLLSGYVSYINEIFKTEDNAAKCGYYPWLFDAKHLYTYNGTPVTFIYTLKFLDVDPPKGYDDENIDNLYAEYRDAAKNDYENKRDNDRPNVIVIMNEAFSELSAFGDIPVNKDYMPYIHSLIESGSVIHGSTVVSVKGGNTANSEFEFLTGASMAFLPAETIPYQQYIDGKTDTLVAQMNTFGYRTVAMHNYYRNGWKRDQTYDYFGFDEKYFIEDMKDVRSEEYIRSYLSDRSMYERIINLYEADEGDDPLFLFGITMQNHGSYTDDLNGSFIPEIETMYPHEYFGTESLDNFLSLMYETDKAYEYLINYFSGVTEKTIIIMFGDHQPFDAVVQPIFNNNGISDADSLEIKYERYQTPYLIWSNYDLGYDEDIPKEVSLNYFGGVVMDIIGIPLTPFQMYQKELMTKYPTINAFSYTDADGNLHSASGIQKISDLNMLSQIQYNLIFDRKHTVKEFFRPVTS